MGKQLVYFSAYELTQKYGWDNKGARLSGIFVNRYYYYPVYYLGDSNLLLVGGSRADILDRVDSSPLDMAGHAAARSFLVTSGI